MTAASIIPSTSGKFQKVYSTLIDSSGNIIRLKVMMLMLSMLDGQFLEV